MQYLIKYKDTLPTFTEFRPLELPLYFDSFNTGTNPRTYQAIYPFSITTLTRRYR